MRLAVESPHFESLKVSYKLGFPWMWLHEGEAVINISILSSAEAYNFESSFLGKKHGHKLRCYGYVLTRWVARSHNNFWNTETICVFNKHKINLCISCS